MMKFGFVFLVWLLTSGQGYTQSGKFVLPLRSGTGSSKLFVKHDRGNIVIKGHDQPSFIIIVEGQSPSALNIKTDSIVEGYPKLIIISSELWITQDKNELNIRSVTDSKGKGGIYNVQVLVPYNCLVKATINQQGEIHVQHIKGTVNLNNSAGGKKYHSIHHNQAHQPSLR